MTRISNAIKKPRLKRAMASEYQRSTGDFDSAYCRTKASRAALKTRIVEPRTAWRNNVGPEELKNGGKDPDKTMTETTPTKINAVAYATRSRLFLLTVGVSPLLVSEYRPPVSCTIEAASGHMFPMATLWSPEKLATQPDKMTDAPRMMMEALVKRTVSDPSCTKVFAE